MKYYDFDIWIQEIQDSHYPVRARFQLLREVAGRLAIDPNSSEMKASLSRLGKAEECNDAFLKTFGKTLFAHLINGDVERRYREGLGQLYGDDGSGLRIRLRIEPAEISALPWELMYDELHDCFLATSSETPLTRYVELAEPIRELKSTAPSRVLVVIPCCSGLDVETEKKTLQETFDDFGNLIEYKILDGNVTSEAINKALILARYHILHFIGHGAVSGGKECLVINSEDGGVESVEAERFAFFFEDYPSMKLVFLSTFQGADIRSTQPFTSVARDLVKKGLPAVIAMQLPTTSKATNLFAGDFYTKLLTGFERGRIDTAISHARKRVRQELGADCGFISPILFMRSANGIIFDLQKTEDAKDPLPKILRLRDVADTYQNNIDLLETKRKDQAGAPEKTVAVAESIAEQQNALKLIKGTIRQLNIALVRSAAPKVVLFAIIISIIIFLASWTKFLNIVDIDDWVTRTFRPIVGKHMEKSFNKRVAVILASDDDNGGLGVPAANATWRGYYTEMIPALNKAGAKEIVFDLHFTNETAADKKFAEAISLSVNNPGPQKPTEVIAGEHVLKGQIQYDVAATLKLSLKDRLGNTLVGGQYNDYLRVYQLAYSPAAGQPVEGTEIPVGSSLALLAIIHDENDPLKISPFFNRNDGLINLRSGGPDGPVIKQIPVVEKDGSLDFMFDVAEQDDLNRATYPFRDVYNSIKNNEYANLENFFSGRIVLIGYVANDVHRVIGNQSRSGIHIQASIISNILNGVYIRPLPVLYNILIIAAMVVIGIFLQTRLRRLLRFKITLPLPRVNKEIEVPVLWFVVVITYLILSFICYQYTLRAFDMSYHLAAFWLSFAFVRIARRILGLK